jgi:hypothetical protein
MSDQREGEAAEGGGEAAGAGVAAGGEGDLLAVDVGLRFGLARIEAGTGRIMWHRSQHVADRAALKRAIWGLLVQEREGLGGLVIEGGGPLAAAWASAAVKRSLGVEQVGAEAWRADMLYGREQRSGAEAKRHAVKQARELLAAQGTRALSGFMDDAAEAILLGVWAGRRRGWGSAGMLADSL